MFPFLDRVAGPFWDRVRDLIEDWLSRYYADEVEFLVSAMKQKDNRAFAAGFWELYLHETLARGGFAVECHPPIEGTDKRPDFRTTQDDTGFYLEARVVSDSDSDVKATARRDRSALPLSECLGIQANRRGSARVAPDAPQPRHRTTRARRSSGDTA